MRKLSDDAQQILQRLFELDRSGSWFGRTGRVEKIMDLLDQLATLGEANALPDVVRFVVNSSSSIQLSARLAVDRLLENISPYDLIHIGDRLRLDWSYGWFVNHRWHKIEPNDVSGLAGKPSEPSYIAVLGFLTFHRNGYVRHKAVELLAECHGGRELPFLLIRQNDWVQPIADDARSAVVERIDDSQAKAFADSLRLIFHLTTLGRRDHGSVVQQIIQFLCRERHADILRHAVLSPDRIVRRQVVRHALGTPGDHHDRIVSLGSHSPDPIVRLRCCTSLRLAFDDNRHLGALDRFVADNFMAVRKEALRIKAEQVPSNAIDIWRQALLDSSRSIRDLARFQLTKLGITDIVEVYRAALAKNPDQLSALEGLAECGDARDCGVMRELLNHALPSRRVVAIQGLNRIEKEAATSNLMPLLNDTSPRVIREAQLAVSQNLQLVPGEVLLEIATNPQSPVASRSAVGLIEQFGKWRSIPWLLRIVAAADCDTAELAKQTINAWFEPLKCNKVFVRPSVRDKHDIESALLEVQGQITPELSELLERELGKFQ